MGVVLCTSAASGKNAERHGSGIDNLGVGADVFFQNNFRPHAPRQKQLPMQQKAPQILLPGGGGGIVFNPELFNGNVGLYGGYPIVNLGAAYEALKEVPKLRNLVNKNGREFTLDSLIPLLDLELKNQETKDPHAWDSFIKNFQGLGIIGQENEEARVKMLVAKYSGFVDVSDAAFAGWMKTQDPRKLSITLKNGKKVEIHPRIFHLTELLKIEMAKLAREISNEDDRTKITQYAEARKASDSNMAYGAYGGGFGAGFGGGFNMGMGGGFGGPIGGNGAMPMPLAPVPHEGAFFMRAAW